MAVVCPSVCLSVCPVPDPKSRMKGRSKLNIGRKETHNTGDPWPIYRVKGRRSRSPGGLKPRPQINHIFRTGWPASPYMHGAGACVDRTTGAKLVFFEFRLLTSLNQKKTENILTRWISKTWHSHDLSHSKVGAVGLCESVIVQVETKRLASIVLLTLYIEEKQDKISVYTLNIISYVLQQHGSWNCQVAIVTLCIRRGLFLLSLVLQCTCGLVHDLVLHDCSLS